MSGRDELVQCPQWAENAATSNALNKPATKSTELIRGSERIQLFDLEAHRDSILIPRVSVSTTRTVARQFFERHLAYCLMPQEVTSPARLFGHIRKAYDISPAVAKSCLYLAYLGTDSAAPIPAKSD
jgi:hypothetical protein